MLKLNHKLPQQVFLSSDFFIKKQLVSKEYKLFFMSILQIKNIIVISNHTLGGSTRSFTRLKNLCMITSRARGVRRSVKISRHKLRSLSVRGNIVGLRKIGW